MKSSFAGRLCPLACADKAALAEANKKVLAQVNSVFAYGQAVQTGLAFKNLSTAP